MSEKAGLIGPDVTARLAALLAVAGLKTELPDWKENRAAYLRALAVDKKMREEKVGFVVLRELGRAEQMRLSPEDILAGIP